MKFGAQNIQPEKVTHQRSKYAEYTQRVENRKKGLTQKGRPPAQPNQWNWAFEGQTGTVSAFTRSQARAKVKEFLGVKRLPKECHVTQAQ